MLGASHPPATRLGFVTVYRRIKRIRTAVGLRVVQAWGRRVVAYRSQFRGADDRAHAGKARIKVRLIGDCDPDEWDLPPKPKWMRWRTYNRYVDRYDAYEDILDWGTVELVARLFGRSA